MHPDDAPARAAPEHMLLAAADHLHAHCTCRPTARGDAQCAACGIRMQLRAVRERTLWIAAEHERIRRERDEALASAGSLMARQAGDCDRCEALRAMLQLTRG